jgi:hypothetical protein
MVVTPLPTPVTTPVAGLMVATAVLVLLQTPPAPASVRVLVVGEQNNVVPDIVPATARGLTVTAAVAEDEPQLADVPV